MKQVEQGEISQVLAQIALYLAALGDAPFKDVPLATLEEWCDHLGAIRDAALNARDEMTGQICRLEEAA